MTEVGKHSKNVAHTEERLGKMKESDKDAAQIKRQEEILQEMKMSKSYSILRLKDNQNQLFQLRSSAEITHPQSLECKNAGRLLEEAKEFILGLGNEDMV